MLSPSEKLSNFEEEAQKEKQKRQYIGNKLRRLIQQHQIGQSDQHIVNLYNSYETLDPRDEEGRTPLHIAAELGNFEILYRFIKLCGATIDTVDFGKQTPLHLATMNGHVACVEKLLEVGANTELVDRNGHLPRFYSKTKEMWHHYANPPKMTTSVRSQLDRPEKPVSPQKEMCEYFWGSIWGVYSSFKWRLLPVWDLVYEPEDGLYEPEGDGKNKSFKKKWIHLPIVSKNLVIDLLKTIYAASYRDTQEFKDVEKFINAVFNGVEGKLSNAQHYFKVSILFISRIQLMSLYLSVP